MVGLTPHAFWSTSLRHSVLLYAFWPISGKRKTERRWGGKPCGKCNVNRRLCLIPRACLGLLVWNVNINHDFQNQSGEAYCTGSQKRVHWRIGTDSSIFIRCCDLLTCCKCFRARYPMQCSVRGPIFAGYQSCSTRDSENSDSCCTYFLLAMLCLDMLQGSICSNETYWHGIRK